MNPSILFICMDSLRYDNYVKAHTPNLDSVGELRRLYSDACWTIPSIVSYLMNRPPVGFNEPLFPTMNVDKPPFVPKYYYNKKYTMALLTSNAYVEMFNGLTNKGYSKWFHYWNTLKYLNDKHHATKPIVEDAVNIIQKTNDKPLFMFILFMDTHHPYYDGEKKHFPDPNSPQENMGAQVRAAEYIDRETVPLLKAFRETYPDRIIYVTADHGEDERYGHDPVRRLPFSDKLFEIPFIKGK